MAHPSQKKVQNEHSACHIQTYARGGKLDLVEQALKITACSQTSA